MQYKFYLEIGCWESNSIHVIAAFLAEKRIVVSTYDAFTLISVSFIGLLQKELCAVKYDARVANFVSIFYPPFVLQ